MVTPDKPFDSLQKIAERWHCSIRDILEVALSQELELEYFDPVMSSLGELWPLRPGAIHDLLRDERAQFCPSAVDESGSTHYLNEEREVTLETVFVTREERERYEKEHPELISADGDPREAETEDVNLFYLKDDDFWIVRYQGIERSIKSTIGMQYIAELLRKPNKELSASELRAVEARAPPQQDEDRRESAQGEIKRETLSEVSELGNAGTTLDEKARRQYKTRLQELVEEIKQAIKDDKKEKHEELEKEREWLIKELTKGVDKKGKLRADKSDVDRQRQTVRHAIETAIRNIRKKHTKAAEFLEKSIKTGYTCVYKLPSDNPVNWRT